MALTRMTNDTAETQQSGLTEQDCSRIANEVVRLLSLKQGQRWPPVMSYATVAEYMDLPGACHEVSAKRQGRDFCLRNGITVYPVGKYKISIALPTYASIS